LVADLPECRITVRLSEHLPCEYYLVCERQARHPGLGISIRTVQKHLEHIYVKLGVENRTAAAHALTTPRADSRHTADPLVRQ
jgi:hypothetical protein